MSVKVIAPGRVVLFGEHQDYLGLPVIPAAIDLHIAVTGDIDTSGEFRINLPDIGLVEEFNSSDLTNLSKRAYLKSCVKTLQQEEIIPFNAGASAIITSKIPIKAGLSSSSALNVVWIKFLAELYGHELNPMKLTDLAYKAEVLEFKEPGGMMDQMVIANGYVNYQEFEPVRCTQVLKSFPGLVIGDSNEKKDTLHTLSTIREGVATALASIDKSHVKNVDINDLDDINTVDPFAKSCLIAAVKNYSYTKSAFAELRNYQEEFSHDMIGYLMNDHHTVLRDYLEISTPKIEKMIIAANKAGALGCKITGSGNGGCMIAFCPGKEEEVANAIRSEGGIAYPTRVVSGASRVELEGDHNHLDAELETKVNKAIKPIRNKSVIVAFSGGVDSTVVAMIVKNAARKVKLVTIVSEWISAQEQDEAINIAKKLDIPHQIFPVKIDKDHIFWKNPPDRCYHCKLLIFSQLQQMAEGLDFDLVIDGTNASDTSGHRPGLKALQKLKIYSPLLSGNISKKEVRKIATFYELTVAQKPAMACLASRIPYKEPISLIKLDRVEKAESFLRTLNLGAQLELRDHRDLARIEVSSFPDLNQTDILKIVEKLKSLGYRYVTLDLEGYRPITLD